MKMQFFTIPIRDPQRATDELNAFLSRHRVVHTERQFVADGANSVWLAAMVCWLAAISSFQAPGSPLCQSFPRTH
jgi:hypothetical protein